MNMPEIHRRGWNGKRRVIVLLLDLIAVGEQGGNELMHALERTVTEARVAGMPGLPEEFDRHGQIALMLSDRFETGRLTDNTEAAEFFTVVCNQFCAAHGGFFVGGRHQRQRVFEFIEIHLAAGVQRECEETFHVATAEPVDVVVLFAGGERVVGPQCRITGYGVGMSRQHQSVAAAAGARDQVILAFIDGLQLDIETQACGPVCNEVDDRAIAHVHIRMHAAHRRG